MLNIPAGWALCNGENGTPDLQNNFVVGAGDTYAVDGVGGSINHNHTFNDDGHTHTFSPGSGLSLFGGGSNTTDETIATGTTDNANGLPPYYGTAYIMEL